MQESPKSTWPKWLVALALIAAAFLLLRQIGIGEYLRRFVEIVESLGAWGPALFLLIYLAATVLLLPGSILTLGAGTAFGLWKGFVLVSAASTIGAVAAFLIGRHLARERVAKRIAGNRTFEAIDEAIAREGWKVVALTRLTPLLPFALLNYALGLTRVRTLPYALASWLGMMPGTLMYVYIGSLGNAGAKQGKTAGEWALFGVGLLATVAVTVLVSRAAGRAIKQKVDVSRRGSSSTGS